MKRHTRRTRYAIGGLLFALVATGLLAAWMDQLGWVMLVLAAIWVVFFVGNVLIYGYHFIRHAERGEKWFAAALLFALAILLLFHIMAPGASN